METLTLQPAEPDAGKRVDAWLAGQMDGLTRSAAQRLLEDGRVVLDGKPLAKTYRLTGKEALTVSLPDPEPLDAVPQDIPLDVVYEDADVIVVNKPKGLVVHPAPGPPGRHPGQRPAVPLRRKPLRRGRGPPPRHRPPH